LKRLQIDSVLPFLDDIATGQNTLLDSLEQDSGKAQANRFTQGAIAGSPVCKKRGKPQKRFCF